MQGGDPKLIGSPLTNCLEGLGGDRESLVILTDFLSSAGCPWVVSLVIIILNIFSGAIIEQF